MDQLLPIMPRVSVYPLHLLMLRMKWRQQHVPSGEQSGQEAVGALFYSSDNYVARLELTAPSSQSSHRNLGLKPKNNRGAYVMYWKQKENVKVAPAHHRR